jgi:hypothetical protein
MSSYNFIEGNSNTVDRAGGGEPAAQDDADDDGDQPEHTLHAFADIVSYSGLSIRLQKLSQDDLVAVLNHSLAEAGVRPERVAAQDQGDARLLAFPPGTDIGKVLAVTPMVLNNDLVARNREMAERARMRVRLAFSMGVSMPGKAGLVGAAPIAVARLANSDQFRRAMRAAPLAQCGVLIDDYLHSQWITREFGTDINPDDYVKVHVSYPDKGFEATAWMRLFGYSGGQVSALLG